MTDTPTGRVRPAFKVPTAASVFDLLRSLGSSLCFRAVVCDKDVIRIREEKKREFDKYSVRRLIQLCSEGHGNIIGFHPEGRRNLKGGTYDFLPAQPGIGKIIYSAHPQVIPVFIAGLGNDLPKQILGNWKGGPKVRIWFGEPVDLSQYYEKSDRLRTHKEIGDHLMIKIAELGQMDRGKFE